MHVLLWILVKKGFKASACGGLPVLLEACGRMFTAALPAWRHPGNTPMSPGRRQEIKPCYVPCEHEWTWVNMERTTGKKGSSSPGRSPYQCFLPSYGRVIFRYGFAPSGWPIHQLMEVWVVCAFWHYEQCWCKHVYRLFVSWNLFKILVIIF